MKPPKTNKIGKCVNKFKRCRSCEKNIEFFQPSQEVYIGNDLDGRNFSPKSFVGRRFLMNHDHLKHVNASRYDRKRKW